eukprot:896018-Lingulodinium_polyedra.AAC.1
MAKSLRFHVQSEKLAGRFSICPRCATAVSEPMSGREVARVAQPARLSANAAKCQLFAKAPSLPARS